MALESRDRIATGFEVRVVAICLAESALYGLIAGSAAVLAHVGTGRLGVPMADWPLRAVPYGLFGLVMLIAVIGLGVLRTKTPLGGMLMLTRLPRLAEAFVAIPIGVAVTTALSYGLFLGLSGADMEGTGSDHWFGFIAGCNAGAIAIVGARMAAAGTGAPMDSE